MKFISLIILLVSAQAYAIKFPINHDLRIESAKSKKGFTQGYDFEGIVAISNCSGSLVQFQGMSDQNQAYVMTNGHCVDGGFTNPGEINYKKPSSKKFTLLNPNATNAGRITAIELVYSTMTNTDLALYRVQETYADIKTRYGIRPLIMDAQKPVVGENIEVISGFWRRGYTCGIEKFVPTLREDRWTFADSIRYTSPGCETIGGTSGSPILRAGTKTVIGINNTGNESGGRCTMNNPCEVDSTGQISVTEGASYGQQTYNIYTCLTATNDIDLSLATCTLPK